MLAIQMIFYRISFLQKKDVILDSKIINLDSKQQEMTKDLKKTILTVEELQSNQKAIIEGQQTATRQLERKIENAVKELKETDTTFELALKKVSK